MNSCLSAFSACLPCRFTPKLNRLPFFFVNALRHKVCRTRRGRNSFGAGAIIQHLEAFTDLVVTEGTIYPILGRLTREGLLDAQWVEGEAPHPRKYYRLTKLGAKRLDHMTREWRAFAEKINRLIDAAQGHDHAAH